MRRIVKRPIPDTNSPNDIDRDAEQFVLGTTFIGTLSTWNSDPHPANPNQPASNCNISVVDHAEDLRDFIATSEYGEKATSAAAAKAKQQQTRNVQPAPKL
jgi:hypothetical protein